MNKNEEKTPKKGFNKKTLKIGSLSITVTAVVVAIFIVLNLFVGELPSTLTKYDLSPLELYTISGETEAILRGVNEDVHFYILASRGDEDATIREMLERYHAMNSHITYSTVDPVTNPSFIEKYTSDSLAANSVIAESAKRSYVIDYNEIYQRVYSEEDYYNYYYYGQIPSGTPYYYGELMFTTAVDFVTRDDLPVMYALTGHGETELGDTYVGYIKNENVATSALTLLNIDAIPADCTTILINAPTSDISAQEEDMLESYVKDGGNLILVTGGMDYNAKSMPNLAALAKSFGLESADGVVVETNRNNYMMYPHYLLPQLGSTDYEPLSLLPNENIYVLAALSHGILSDGTHAVIPLLSTSSDAYVKTDLNAQTLEKEDGDLEGMVYIGAAVEDTGKFVWFSSEAITDESADQTVSGGNSSLFLAAVDWMNGNQTNLSILGKQMQVEALTVTNAQATIWSAVVVIVVPAAVLAIGFAIWFKRRKK